MAALAAAGAWLFGVISGLLIWGIWRHVPPLPADWPSRKRTTLSSAVNHGPIAKL